MFGFDVGFLLVCVCILFCCVGDLVDVLVWYVDLISIFCWLGWMLLPKFDGLNLCWIDLLGVTCSGLIVVDC